MEFWNPKTCFFALGMFLWTLGAPMESTSKLGWKQISFLRLILFHSWSSKLKVPMQNSSKIGQKQLSWLLAFFSLMDVQRLGQGLFVSFIGALYLSWF